MVTTGSGCKAGLGVTAGEATEERKGCWVTRDGWAAEWHVKVNTSAGMRRAGLGTWHVGLAAGIWGMAGC